MSIDDSSLIDAIGTDRKTGSVVLSVFDHLPWGNPEHLDLLAAKINAYFSFLESGELSAAYPSNAGKSVFIDVVCKFAPDSVGERLLTESSRIASEAGWSLAWRVVSAT